MATRLSRGLSSGSDVSSSSHHLYTAMTRDSLGSYHRDYSRSATPSTILDESGQSVPPSFDEFEEDDEHVNLHIKVPPKNVLSSRLTVKEVVDREGMPRHLYGRFVV